MEIDVHHERVGFIDGDMGQATLGPPTTMTLALGEPGALNEPGDDAFPPTGPRHRFFVGDVTPRGHMLPTLVGAHRLVQKAHRAALVPPWIKLTRRQQRLPAAT